MSISPSPYLGLPPPTGSWDGWATTTVFGDGETVWPSGVANSESLLSINNPNSLPHATFGAAIPWRFYCKMFGGRSELLQAIQLAWTKGTSSAKVGGPPGGGNGKAPVMPRAPVVQRCG